MFRPNTNSFTAVHILSEFFTVSGAVLLAHLVAQTPDAASPWPWTLAILTGFAFTITGLRLNFYESKRTEGLKREIWVVALTTTICFTAASWFLIAIGQGEFSPAFLRWGWTFTTGGPCLLRLTTRLGLRTLRRHGHNERKVLLVGNNSRSANLVRKLRTKHHYGLRVVGLIDSHNPLTEESPDVQTPFLGRIEDLPELVSTNPIDQVICCLPLKSCYAEVQDVVRMCEEIGLPVMILSDVFQTNVARKSIRWLGEQPLICYSSGPSGTAALATKRLMDVCVAAAALLILSPLMTLIACLVKLTSKGPIIFRQTRTGLNGERFEMLKFRSMVANAERDQEALRGQNEMVGPVFKIKKDPRVTKIGAFLRKTSLDELPQLYNVLRGHMSLVGPRPPIPKEVEQYEWWQRRRLSMRPGITCIWQVSGRNQIPFEKWMEMDLEYIDNWSLGLDLRLLIKTARLVLAPTGM